jgi:hypothetical protein
MTSGEKNLRNDFNELVLLHDSLKLKEKTSSLFKSQLLTPKNKRNIKDADLIDLQRKSITLLQSYIIDFARRVSLISQNWVQGQSKYHNISSNLNLKYCLYSKPIIKLKHK